MNIRIGILKKYQIGLNVFPYRFLQVYANLTKKLLEYQSQ